MEDILPLVSIGVASYNNAIYITETLESIRNQTYSNIFLIIVDDCSTDNSTAIIKTWISEHSVECLFIENKVNMGISAFGNLVIKNAKGKYLSFIGSDDVLLPDKVEIQLLEFEKLDEDYAIVYGDTMKIDAGGNIIADSLFETKFGKNWGCLSGDVFTHVVDDFFFYTQSSLIRIESLKRIKFEFNGRYISEDWYMQLRLAQNFKVQGTNALGSKYRIISTSMGARFWNDENYHTVFYSQFLMFNSLFSFEKRKAERWDALVKKLKYLLYLTQNSKNRTNKSLYLMSLTIFRRTYAKKDLINIFRLIFGRKTKTLFGYLFNKNR